jgi:hypothetical protein
MRGLASRALALAVSSGALCASHASGQTAHVEEFSNDLDAGLFDYEPTSRDPLNDPFLDGIPPTDWRDIRTGHLGVIEENMSTVGDDASYPAADPGAATAQYGVLQPDSSGDGPYWLAPSWDAGQTAVSFNVDVYADPAIVGNANNLFDFWWSNGVGNPDYLTESGFQVQAEEVAADTWSFTSPGSGVIVATVPVGSWYEMETAIYPGLDGTLDITNSLWNADHTVLLGTYTTTTPFQDPVNQQIKPIYTWFTFFDENIDVIFIDDVTIGSVPEPSGAAIVSVIAAAGALARRRRGR